MFKDNRNGPSPHVVPLHRLTKGLITEARAQLMFNVKCLMLNETKMVRYILKQIKIASSRAYGKWFAKNVVEETIDLDGLAEHMSNHNSPYSKGVIKGLLTDMIGCIKELLLEGKNVKIDDLAIFSLGIKNKLAANSEDDFTVSKNVEGVKLRARATGELMSKSLNLEATLKKATFVNGKLTTEPSNGGGNTGGGGSSSTPSTGGDESNGD